MLPDDDERNDGADVEQEVARPSRAVHLQTSGNGITLHHRRCTFTSTIPHPANIPGARRSIVLLRVLGFDEARMALPVQFLALNCAGK